MTAFDAPRYLPVDQAPLRSARMCFASRPVVTVLSVLALASLVAVTLLLVVVLDNLPRVVERLVEKTGVAIVLNAELTRPEAEALKARLLALPAVGTAFLRTREEGIASLASDGVAVPRGQNPLPDILVASLRMDDRARSIGPRFEAFSQTVSALPGVHAVSIDRRWVETLGVVQEALASGREVGGVAALAIVGLLMACVSYLSGAAFGNEVEEIVPLSARVSIGMVLAFLAAALALLGCWSTWRLVADHVSPDWLVTIASVRVEAGVIVATLLATAIVIVAGTLASAARR